MLLSHSEIIEVNRQLKEQPEKINHLRDLAQKLLLEGPFSVTYNRSLNSKGSAHDYYSEGPYWWPDEENPSGPYIRKDGLANPNHFSDHKLAMRQVSKSVLTLAAASYHLNNALYKNHAFDLIKVWFIDHKTKMTPHLEYGQSIPGICDGRGIGIIDTLTFIELIEGVSYLEMICSEEQKEVIEALKEWFRDFLQWMCTSEKGLEEKNNGNNHATWWAAQVLCYGLFVGDEDKCHMAIDFYKNHLLPEQMTNTGAFPEELARTRAYHYTEFNLLPMAFMAEYASKLGENLWSYETDSGLSISLGYDFYIPYMVSPKSWPYASLDPLEEHNSLLLILGAKRLKDKRLIEIYEERRHQILKQDSVLTHIMLPLYLFESI